MQTDILVKEQFKPMENNTEYRVDTSTNNVNPNQINNQVQRQQVNYQTQTVYQPQPMNQRIVNNLQNPNIQQNGQMTVQNQMYQNRQMYSNQPQTYNAQKPIQNPQNNMQGNQ